MINSPKHIRLKDLRSPKSPIMIMTVKQSLVLTSPRTSFLTKPALHFGIIPVRYLRMHLGKRSLETSVEEIKVYLTPRSEDG